MKTLAILLTTVTLLLLPFAIWDVQSFWYGMVTSYRRVIKHVVWGAADQGAIRTIGITGWLLSHHLERFVEVTQLCALAIVYAVAWRALRRGARPLPWMGCALLTFSMTTLWPVSYIYFDVLLLFVSAAAAETLGRPSPRAIAEGWAMMLATAIVLVGTSIVTPEWRSIRLHPPPSAWRVGANELRLHSSTPRTVAVSRFEVSMPTEPHGR